MMSKFLSEFLQDQSGTTGIEYALIAAGLSVAIIAGVAALSSGIQGDFNEVGTAIK